MLSDLPTSQWFRRGFVAAFMVGIVLLTYMVLHPFIVPTIWAAILAYVSWPLHIRVSRMIRRRQTAAAMITTLLVSLIIVVPIIWLIMVLQSELLAGWGQVQSLLARKPALPTAVRDLPIVGAWVAERWAELLADPNVLKKGMQTWVTQSADEVSGVVGGVGRNAAKLFIALFAMFFFLRDGARFFVQMRSVLEGMLGPATRNYLKAIGDTTQAVVYALVLAALAQGLVAGIGYAIAGFDAPIFLGAITALVALIPFATPLMWSSLSIWLIVSGNVGAGVFLLIWGTALVSTVDNVVRPLVISNHTTMPLILVVFGVLGGVLAFGLVGLFIGPVILAVSLAIWREWLAQRRQVITTP